MKLEGSIAVITGASNDQGIGAAICRKLAKEGADIFFTHWGSRDDWVVNFQDEIIQESGVRCSNLEIDLSEPKAPLEILDMVTHQLGMPTILVNNAAHSTRDGYMKLDAKTLDDHYAVNMRATFLLSVEFARRLKQQNKLMGRIINMTSGQALGPMTGELASLCCN